MEQLWRKKQPVQVFTTLTNDNNSNNINDNDDTKGGQEKEQTLMIWAAKTAKEGRKSPVWWLQVREAKVVLESNSYMSHDSSIFVRLIESGWEMGRRL